MLHQTNFRSFKMDFSYLINHFTYENGESIVKEFNERISNKNWFETRNIILDEIIHSVEHDLAKSESTDPEELDFIKQSEVLISWLNFRPNQEKFYELIKFRYYYWFSCLESTRNFKEGRIPWNIILEHARFLELSEKQTLFHIDCIMEMEKINYRYLELIENVQI